MSIEDEIADRAARGMLYPLLPKAPGATIRRALFVGEWLWAELNSPVGGDEWETRIGQLRADLELFVTEEFLDPKYLFRLWPAQDAVWEIRSTRSQPSIRVLGLFPLKDILVSTNYAMRDWLGGWESRQWRQVKRFARAVWRVLFPTYNPIITSDVNDVISGALNAKYFKGP